MLKVIITGQVGTAKTILIESLRKAIAGEFYIAEWTSFSGKEELTLYPERRLRDVQPSMAVPTPSLTVGKM